MGAHILETGDFVRGIKELGIATATEIGGLATAACKGGKELCSSETREIHPLSTVRTAGQILLEVVHLR